MYSTENDCDVLSVYPHQTRQKTCLATVGIEPTTKLRGQVCWNIFSCVATQADKNHKYI